MDSFDKEEKGGTANNPLASISSADMLSADMIQEAMESGGMSAAQLIENIESAGGMTEQELADLTYAFQAADMDGGGAIDRDEFATMLKVMGCEITEEQVAQCIHEAKDGFFAWKKLADAENVEKCKRLWEEYDDDGSGTMDMEELNNVVKALRKEGFKADEITEADLGEGGVEMDFEDFSAWILKQEGLPDSFGAPTAAGTAGLGKSKQGIVKKGFKALLLPVELTAKVAVGPLQLAAKGVQMIPGADHIPGIAKKHDGAVVHGSQDTIANALNDDEEEEEELDFPEYVFMMRSGALRQFLPNDWQERAEDMMKLREAFDTADVDGDNQLELEELEMVIISMNPGADVTPEDVRKVWAVLNPTGKEWIPFSEFVEGMILVKDDPELSAIIPLDVPNRFQLLSLLIDSPINEEQENLIFDNMSGLEKAGVNMLRTMEKPPPDRDQIRTTLAQACNGKLHYLTDQQRKSVSSTHWWCVLQALFIGSFFTFWPGMFENYLVYTLETDGVNDAYWTCETVIGDPNLPPWGTTEQLTLAENMPTWTWLKDYGPVPKQGRCLAGTCVSIPDNFTNYIALNGSTYSGGLWHDEDRDCKKNLLTGEESCDDICTPLKKTWEHDHESMFMFWGLNTTGIVIGIAFELSLLMYTAVRSAVRVSWALDLRLTPLNYDRAFVANMLVRAAFELGDPADETMGVEAGQGGSGERPLWRNILTGAWIKGKVVITGTFFKQIVARTAAYDTATWLKPYLGTMLATAMWDSMMCHVIMKGAELRAIGVTTSVEVFNEIMDTFCPEYEKNPASLPEIAREQILRAIGVAIVKHGAMFPTMEILLRHAINYLGMKKSKAVRQSGIIDNEELFMDSFADISLDAARAALCTHMLCYVLDGSVGISELNLWQHIQKRVEEEYQKHRTAFDSYSTEELRDFIVKRSPNLTKAVSRVPTDDPDSEMEELRDIAKSVPQPRHVTHFDQLIPRVVCQKFRNNEPVTVNMLMACYDPEEHKDFMSKTLTPKEITNFMRREAFYNVTMVLTGDIFNLCC